MKVDLRFRVEVESQQKAVALRDAVADELEGRGATVIARDEARVDRTFFVAASISGKPHQVEVDAADEQDAIDQVAGKGTVVVGVSETPITPPEDVDA